MRRHPTIGIKTCLMLAAALVVAVVNWTHESCRAIAQTDNGRSLAAQEEKPFDQKHGPLALHFSSTVVTSQTYIF
jgi:hypothetical protein